MPRDIVYFDLETQRTANDAGGWTRKCDMRMSVGVIFSTATGRYEVFSEAQVNQLIERLRRADLVIGFNVLNFDYQVLMGYTILDLIAELQTADLMVDMEKRLGPSARVSTRSPTRRSAFRKPPPVSMRSAGGAKGGCSRSRSIAAST